MVEYTDPTHTDDGGVNVNYNHPDYGWIPFTCRLDDPDPALLGPRILALIEDSGEAVAPYVPPVQPPPDYHRDLTPSEFEWLLAYTGLDTLWSMLEDASREAGMMGTYANLKSNRRKSFFEMDLTLLIVASFRPQAVVLMPDADITDETIIAVWELVTGKPPEVEEEGDP